MNAIAHQKETSLARPLAVLVPLIKKDLQEAKEAAEQAAAPYYIAIGEKLSEAKAQCSWSELYVWSNRNFGISKTQTHRYIDSAKTTFDLSRAADYMPPPTMSQALREAGQEPRGPSHPAWHEPIKNTLSKVDIETLNIRKIELKRADECEAQRQLALQLIDIGYKALASRLHPDKGGSRDAMSRLNQVRERLKGCA